MSPRTCFAVVTTDRTITACRSVGCFVTRRLHDVTCATCRALLAGSRPVRVPVPAHNTVPGVWALDRAVREAAMDDAVRVHHALFVLAPDGERVIEPTW